jgi:hypothetical protein
MAEPVSEPAAPPAARTPAGCATRPARTIRIIADNTGAAPLRRSAPTPRAPADAQPYRAYKPAPFTVAERGEATVLIGGLHWRVLELFQGVSRTWATRRRSCPRRRWQT